MAAKYHISKTGEARECRASVQSCPLGGAEDHFATPAEARQAYEARMTAELLPPGKSKGDLTVGELSKLARVSLDPEVLTLAAETGSERAVRNLAKNPHTPGHILAKAAGRYRGDEAPETRAALTSHPNFPIELMTPTQYAAQVATADYRRQAELLESSAVTDAHLRALEESGAATRGPIGLGAILSNPANQLSQSTIVEFAEKNYNLLGAAMRSGRYPAGRIPSLPEDVVYWGNVYQNEDPEYLDGYSAWAVAHADTHKGQYLASTVARNEHTPDSALRRLVEADLSSEVVVSHPNASETTKAMAQERSPEAARVVKLGKLSEAYPQGLRKALSVSDSTNHPFGPNRGISDTVVHFDTAKLAELGLDREDVFTIMGRGHFNAGASYDERTGIFRGSVDTTD